MKILRDVISSMLACLAAACAAAQTAPLPQLTGAIEMPAVKGRIDHFGIDAKGRRLFVAALGNDTIEVIDLGTGRRERGLRGFGEPQGVLYVPETNRVFVANGSANRVDVLDGTSLAAIKRIGGLEDADNLRYDVTARKVYVGYGGGALRAIDPDTGESTGDIRLPGHPESFQLEQRGTRIFVNVPGAHQVVVAERAKRAVVATWDVPGAAANFPMALDEASHRLFVGARRPAELLVYDTETGKVVARQSIGGDTDDLYFDAARRRLYAVSVVHHITDFRQKPTDQGRILF